MGERGDLDAREDAVEAREHGVDARESAAASREQGSQVREASATEREGAVGLREHLARAREEALAAKREAQDAFTANARLLEQMREANEQLVLAMLRAEELQREAQAARLAIEASEARLRVIVTTSAAVVFQADAAGRIRLDPDAWRGFTGLDTAAAATPENEELLDAVHPSDRPRVQEAWARAVARGSRFESQHRLRRADGSFASVLVCAEPLPRGQPPREWIGTITDVSDRVRMEEAREQFIAILGHDLRGPLTAVSAGAQMLEQRIPSGVDRMVALRIGSAAVRMERMVTSLLDFARARLGGGFPIACSPCDLALVVEQGVAEAAQAYVGRVVTFTTSGDVTGEWDADRLEQVVSNLIANAVRHGADPIELTAKRDGASVVLSVHNEGPPISDAVMPMLFEPYRSRAPGAQGGLGLGLFIVREIVRAHGGEITVDSSKEHGTTFRIVLPRALSGDE